MTDPGPTASPPCFVAQIDPEQAHDMAIWRKAELSGCWPNVAQCRKRRAMSPRTPLRTIVTDRLRSYGAALKDLGRGDDREMGRWVNNRAENSHQPFRRRERAMLRFRRMRSLQKFASVHASVCNHFSQERALNSRSNYKARRAAALAKWRGLLVA